MPKSQFWEAEAEGSRVQDQPELYSNTLSKIQNKGKRNKQNPFHWVNMYFFTHH
jgi:hypothetical protein